MQMAGGAVTVLADGSLKRVGKSGAREKEDRKGPRYVAVWNPMWDAHDCPKRIWNGPTHTNTQKKKADTKCWTGCEREI